MHRSPVVRKRRKGSLDSPGSHRRESFLLKSRSCLRRRVSSDIERICEEADDTESLISSECAEFEPGIDVANATLQVQEIWPSREIVQSLNSLPNSQEVMSLLEKNDLEVIKEFPRVGALFASWMGENTVLEELLTCGVPTDTRDPDGRSLLHLSACVGNVDCLQTLLRHGAQPDGFDGSGWITALHCAAACGSVECVSLLLEAGANIEAGVTMTGSGKPPLYYAVQSNAIACVQKLLANGASVNMSQVYTETPLHVAADLGFAECVRILLDAGADSRVQCGAKKATPLHLAAEDGNAACAKLLIEAGADIRQTTSRRQTPLHLAALAQSATTLELLLLRKADPNAVDADARTPLHCAIVKGSRSCECVKLLLQHGALVNAADAFGYTPVHIAALNDFSSCLRLLLDHGGDVTKTTNGNVSALSFIARRTPEIIKYFEGKLDQAIRLHDHELGDMDCEIQLDFQILVPDIRAGETRLLLTCIEVGQKRLLRHPLVRTFLHLKWRQIRKYFVLSLIVHAIYVLMCSAYIVNVFLKEDLTLTQPLIALNVILLLATCGNFGKEIFQIAHNRRGYVLQWENWLQWFIIITVFITLVPPSWIPNYRKIQHHISVFSIFFNWIELMVLMGRFPMFGIYVQMFTTGAVNFSKFLLAYCCLLAAFACAFRMTFPNYKAFRDIAGSVVKTVVMMTGELEFEDIFYPEQMTENVPYPGTAHLFFLLFTLIVTTVLTNLLVGLSVSDIQGLQRSAGLDRLARQVELVAYMESMLFSQLWNWVPIRVVMLFRRSATLLASARRRTLIVRPNDPREARIPRELVDAVYKSVAERRPIRAKAKSWNKERTYQQVEDVF